MQTSRPALTLAANQNNNSEIAGLLCLQLQIKNSQQSLRSAASKRLELRNLDKPIER